MRMPGRLPCRRRRIHLVTCSRYSDEREAAANKKSERGKLNLKMDGLEDESKFEVDEGRKAAPTKAWHLTQTPSPTRYLRGEEATEDLLQKHQNIGRLQNINLHEAKQDDPNFQPVRCANGE
jgi:hypothetical protein